MAASSPEINEPGIARMRGDERREQLIRVAISLFSRKGFRGTTTKEIAQAAGVTEALIFRHFPTKEALYDAILRWRVENSSLSAGWAAVQELADRRDDVGLFRRVASGMLEFHRENVDFLRLMLYAKLEGHDLGETFRQRHTKHFDEFLRDYVATRQREGAFRDVDPDTAVRAIVGMAFFYSMNENIFQCKPSTLTDDQAIETFVSIALDGLRRQETQQTPEERP